MRRPAAIDIQGTLNPAKSEAQKHPKTHTRPHMVVKLAVQWVQVDD
jgi:hypothetical protein